LGQGSRTHGVLEASKEVQIPRLLAMLCVLAVFVPSFFMTGVSRSLFVPLALAVGFAMASSYFLSSSLVPVLSTWILRKHVTEEKEEKASLLVRAREKLATTLEKLIRIRLAVITTYMVAALVVTVLGGRYMGRAIFTPGTGNHPLLRLRARPATR